MANASDSDSEDWGFESLRVDQKQKAGGACFFVFKKGRETRFRILKPTADEIRENSPVDCSITSGESLRVDQKKARLGVLFSMKSTLAGG